MHVPVAQTSQVVLLQALLQQTPPLQQSPFRHCAAVWHARPSLTHGTQCKRKQ